MSTVPQIESTNFQPPTCDDIREAHARIASHIHRTPVLTSHSLDAMAGAQFFFKCDNFQKTGSFKIRGAANAILSLTEAEAAHGIVTPSSGNHGAAVACAAAWRGVPAYIVMPKNAPAVKCRAGRKLWWAHHFLRADDHFTARDFRARASRNRGDSDPSVRQRPHHHRTGHCCEGTSRRNPGPRRCVRTGQRRRAAQRHLPQRATPSARTSASLAASRRAPTTPTDRSPAAYCSRSIRATRSPTGCAPRSRHAHLRSCAATSTASCSSARKRSSLRCGSSGSG